jgi:hypothetical protein
MGTELAVEGKYRRKSHQVKLHLDGKLITLRGELKLAIALKDVRRAIAKDGRLTIKWNDETIVLNVGDKAERLAEKILHPPSLLDKLGIKPKSVVSVLGLEDPSFLKDLRRRTDSVADGSLEPKSDVVIVLAAKQSDLQRLKTLRRSLQSNGAIWVLWKKGLKGPQDVKESAVFAAGKAHGLVDVKVAAFSDELSALKFVIPVAERVG